MEVRFFTSGREFADLAAPFLNASAVENTMLLANLPSFVAQEDGHSILCLVVENDVPCLAATATPPFPFLISTGDPVSVPVLVGALTKQQITVPGVFGRTDLAGIFRQAWQAETGKRLCAGLAVELHATRRPPPTSVIPGQLRQAEQEDQETVIAFCECFANDPRMSPAERAGARTDAERRMEQGELFLWDDGGTKSIAAYKESLPTGGRLNLVYTPPEYRRRGYASACVAALTRLRFERGWDWCALFIDTSDPAASRMYRNLGFREVPKFQNYDIEPKPQRDAA
jgi:uncharacterized protein